MAYVLTERYQQEHSCITKEEIQWILQKTKRYSHYGMLFTLLATTGMRIDEALNLSLHNISHDMRTIRYAVEKAKTKPNRKGEIEKVRKHRMIVLDPWVSNELKAYCDLHFAVTLPGGQQVYVSHYHNLKQNYNGEIVKQKLFPWEDIRLVETYFHKLRKKMSLAGFDSLRLVTRATRWHGESKTYAVRVHSFRRFAATIAFYRSGKDLKTVQKWIQHSRMQTTDGYIHTPAEIGMSEEEILEKDWSAILGFDCLQLSLSQALPPSQQLLSRF